MLQEQSETDESQALQYPASTGEGHAMIAVNTRAGWHDSALLCCRNNQRQMRAERCSTNSRQCSLLADIRLAQVSQLGTCINDCFCYIQEQSEVDESQAGQHQASTGEGHKAAGRAVGSRAEWQGPSDEDPVSPASSCGSALDPQLYRCAFVLADAGARLYRSALDDAFLLNPVGCGTEIRPATVQVCPTQCCLV